MKNQNILHYFGSIWTPTKMFKNRFTLSWAGMLFIFVFLVSCLMFPITLKTAQLNTVSLETFVPNSLSSVTDMTVKALQDAKNVDNKLHGVPFQTEQTAGWLSDKDVFLNSVDKGIYLDDVGFYLKLNNESTVQVPYTQPLSTETIHSVEDAKIFLSTQWFRANKGYVTGYVLLSMMLIIITNTLLVVIGSAFFLWLTRKSKLFSLKTYKECFHLVLNTLGMPTLITTLLLFMGLDIPTALQLHGLITVVVIVLVLYFTRYNDSYIAQKNAKK